MQSRLNPPIIWRLAILGGYFGHKKYVVPMLRDILYEFIDLVCLPGVQLAVVENDRDIMLMSARTFKITFPSNMNAESIDGRLPNSIIILEDK